MKYVWLVVLVFSMAAQAGEPLVFASTDRKAGLLELYTSEGCSSCPPADRWLSGLADDPRLWTELVPVAFHVDYWDYIGWRDRFASPRFSERQRRYQHEQRIKTVYTPGFVFDGREWRGWFGRKALSTGLGDGAGVLQANLDGGVVELSYSRGGEPDFHVAVLGFGIRSPIGRGENAGRELRHDFVVLGHARARAAGGAATLDLPVLRENNAQRHAIAVWVQSGDSQAPLQATGGWLPEGIY